MLLKTSLLPLWLASLGATIAIPIQSKFWCDPADGDLSTSNVREYVCPPPKDKREQDRDLYTYDGGASKAKSELDGDLYNYIDGDSINYKAKREQDSGLYSKPPKGNPHFPYCPGPPGCAPP